MKTVEQDAPIVEGLVTGRADEKPILNDPHKRTPSQKEADQLFVADYSACSGVSVPTLPSERFAVAGKTNYVEIIIKDKEVRTVRANLIPGLYDQGKIKEALRVLGKQGATPDEITKELWAVAAVREGVMASAENLISRAPTTLAIGPDGGLSIPTLQTRIIGTKVEYHADPKSEPTYSIISSKAEYLELMPILRGATSNINGWCIDVPTPRVADMADEAEHALEAMRAQLQNLHNVTVYSILPVWLRYFSDGDMKSQRSAMYGKRMAPKGHDGYLGPMLYDGPAWKVGLMFGNTIMPGRIFVNRAGRFICSDWCQRELDKSGGIDLITGENTKHTLLTWCAGPGISRFADDKVKQSHGVLRRAVIGPNYAAAAKNPIMSEAGRKIISLMNMIWRNKERGEITPVATNAMGVSSLRVSYLQNGTGMTIFANVNSTNLNYDYAVAVNVRFRADPLVSDGKKLDINHIMIERYKDVNVRGFVQNDLASYDVFKVDAALRKEAMIALRDLCIFMENEGHDTDDPEDE